MFKKKTPVQQGEILELKIEGINHDGEGVAKTEGGFVVFVPGTLPGEKVTAKIMSVQKNFGWALPEAIVSRSTDRREPPCDVYDDCGGCQLQHMDYDSQLKYKQGVVENALQRIGGIEAEVQPTQGLKTPWRYRNKAQFPVQINDGKVIAGFFCKSSHDIVPQDFCVIQHDTIDEVTERVRRQLEAFKVPIYDENTHTGLVRHIMTRVSFTTGKIVIILVTNGREIPEIEQIIEKLTEQIPTLSGIVQNINTAKTNVILGEENITLWGSPYITEKIGHIKYRISPESFFQVNTTQARRLFYEIDRHACLTGEEEVFDLYCGTGTIGLYLARKAKHVTGVELSPSAIEDAKFNAAENNIDNASFHAGRVEEIVPELLKQGQKPDVVIVDPPRKGCDPVLLDTIIQADPKRIVYVSCNPATLARDLKHLVEHGYQVGGVQPVDMFPQTVHVETVVLLVKES